MSEDVNFVDKYEFHYIVTVDMEVSPPKVTNVQKLTRTLILDSIRERMIQNAMNDKNISVEKTPAIANLRRIVMASKARALIHNVTPLLIHSDNQLSLDDFQNEINDKINDGTLQSYIEKAKVEL